MAQILSATQMVYEEKFVNKHNVPALQAVGWEGLFGFTTLAVLLVPMYFIHVPYPFGHPPRFVLEDALDGFVQLRNSPLLCVAVSGKHLSTNPNPITNLKNLLVFRDGSFHCFLQLCGCFSDKGIERNDQNGSRLGQNCSHLGSKSRCEVARVQLPASNWISCSHMRHVSVQQYSHCPNSYTLGNYPKANTGSPLCIIQSPTL